MRLSVASIVVLLCTCLVIPAPVEAGKNGGMTCAACTLIVGLIEQGAQINNRTLQQEADAFCQLLPSLVSGICTDVFNIIGPILFPIIEDCGSPDVACNFLTLCEDQTDICRLFPMPKAVSTEAEYKRLIQQYKETRGPIPKIDLSGLICERSPKLCRVFRHFMGVFDTQDLAATMNLPTFDTDKDYFSSYPYLRGYDWRGKDCDDLNATIFPGRDSSDAWGDYNCNGISGIDLSTGKTYEDEWCGGTQPMGVGLLGDSATAHFRIPADILIPKKWNSSTFEFVLPLLENEGDWPMLSWGTGFMDPNSFIPNVRGPMNSIYNLMKERNECNYNDYQNLGVNGADSGNLRDWAKALNRNGAQLNAQVFSKPMLLFFSMIGNDVCGGEHDFTHMTTPQEYHDNVLAALQTADAFMPRGSVVVLVPVVDGRVLYNAMANRIHPIGETNQDVTYKDLYNYLNCLWSSPCWGWMNSNETVRNTTWKIASSLNAQLPAIVNETERSLKNVKVYYPGNVIDRFLEHPPVPQWELIEPVDGFHPSQTGNALIASAYWETLLNLSIIPPPNPFNQDIINKFGKIRHLGK